jgi:HEAT repeat protein
MLLGPFGIGITAYEYVRKNGGDSSRVNALEAIAEEKTNPIRKELVDALGDKDPGIRAAAAKALASYHLPDVSAAIAQLFTDPKQPVRLTAASAYLIATGASPASPNPNEKQSTPSRRTR